MIVDLQNRFENIGRRRIYTLPKQQLSRHDNMAPIVFPQQMKVHIHEIFMFIHYIKVPPMCLLKTNFIFSRIRHDALYIADYLKADEVVRTKRRYIVINLHNEILQKQ